MKIDAAVFFLSVVAAQALSQAPRDLFSERVLEEKAAVKAFSDAVPFVNGIVSDISKLMRSVRNVESFLQTASQTTKQVNKTTAAKVASKTVGSVKPAANVTVDAKKTQNATDSKKALLAKSTSNAQAFSTQNALESMKGMGVAQMPAMLGLMKGMYANWKDKISMANKKEQDQKKSFEAEIARLEEKKRGYKGDVNATKMYDNMENYWKKQRNLAHRQYHTSLKLMHAGMEKMKVMIGAMGDAVAGKKPTKKEMAKVEQMMPPEVVFLQRQVKLFAAWAKGATSMLRDARNPHPGQQYAKIVVADGGIGQ